MQQPMPIRRLVRPTTAMNMALALMAKAFKLNYSTPTNNNQRISSNPQNRQNVGNQVVQNQGVQNVGNQNRVIVVPGIANQNGDGNVVAARAEDNAKWEYGNHDKLLIAQKEEAGIQLQAEEFDLMAAAADLGMRFERSQRKLILSVEQGGGTVEQHFANVEETRAYHESLFHNLAVEVEKVNSVNRKMKEKNAELTTELA
ncbi:hypothetical protein Tco_0287241 [Tanacetum coccineum]